MKRVLHVTVALLVPALWLSAQPARGQMMRDGGPDMTLAPAARQEVIDGVLRQLAKDYVFPETAKKMETAIRGHLTHGDYDAVTSARGLARRLTTDLQAVSHDKHLRVFYSAETLPPEREGPPPPAAREEMRRHLTTQNFGFEKVERLAGNIGYLDLRGFMPAEMAGETAAAAMNFLTNADALIIDLRKNGGGSPDMVALLCSYLFPADPVVHLNDLYFRPDDSTHQWWTLPYVPGKRFVDKSVYVLTSKRTFSAAEECTYNLKNQKRATIVGETTGGGAHPGGTQRITEHFMVWVPSGRAINPVTHTNWEGTGVKPDVAVPADQALATAYLLALDKALERHKDEREVKREITQAKEKATKELEQLKGGKPAVSSKDR